MPSPPLLILMRHGESMWNRSKENPSRAWRYAGSVDVPLSVRGVEEAVLAGNALKDLPVDVVFTSNLVRASTTAFVALNNHSSGRTPFLCTRDGKVCSAAKAMQSCNFDEDDEEPHNATPDNDVETPASQEDEEDKRNSDDDDDDDELLGSSDVLLPVIASDCLIERSFGSLAGVSSKKHSGLFTPKQLKGFREEYNTPFPNGESSKDVFERVIPYFQQEILPLLLSGRNVLIVSHGFVMRVLIQYLENMNETEWSTQMQIEKSHPLKCRLAAHTGVPQMYALDNKAKQTFVSVRPDKENKHAEIGETYRETMADVTKRKTETVNPVAKVSTPVVAAISAALTPKYMAPSTCASKECVLAPVVPASGTTIAQQSATECCKCVPKVSVTSPRLTGLSPPTHGLVVATAHLPTETLGESHAPDIPRQRVAC